MLHRRVALILTAALFCAGSAIAQTKQPPLRTGVDGTFAPHAMPKLGGGIEGFQIDLFTEVARRMKREITIDSVSFSTLIPGMLSGRYDFIAAPTTVTKERAEQHALHRRLPVDRVPVRHQEGLRSRSRTGPTSRARWSRSTRARPTRR